MRFTEQTEIESISFAARANVASDLNTFLDVITAEPAVLSLQNRLRENPSMIDCLVNALEHLCDLDCDSQYELSVDSAVATYGWTIVNLDPTRSRLVIDLLGALQNSWWSSELAKRIQTKHLEETQSVDSRIRNCLVHSNIDDVNPIWTSYLPLFMTRKRRVAKHWDRPYPITEPLEVLPEMQKSIRNTLYRQIQAHLANSTKPDRTVFWETELITSSCSRLNFFDSDLKKDVGWHLKSESAMDRLIVSFHRHERSVA